MSVSLLFALRFPSSPVPTACSCAFKKQQHTMLTGMSTGRLGVGSRSGHDMLGNLDLHAFRAAVTHSGQIFLRASKSQFTAKSPGESPERRVLPVPGKVPGVKGVGNQHDVASALFCTFLVGETLQRAGDVPFFNIRPILLSAFLNITALQAVSAIVPA